jgi:protein TonB
MMVLVDTTTMERMTAVATDPSAAAPPATTLSAEPAERVAETRAPSSLVGVNRWIAIGAALALHLAILAPIWLQFDWAPRAAPPSEEIPVEIVVEPPKPPPQPPPQPSPEPAPPKPPIDFEPAHDAPRGEASDVKTPRYGAVAAKNAEKQATPDQPQTGDKAASENGAKPVEPTSDHQAEAKDDGGPQKASDEAFSVAEPPATAATAPDSQVKVATMIGQPLPTWSKGKQFSTFEPVPDAEFRGDAASAVGGGTADTTYPSVVDGMLMKHLRMTDAVRAEYGRVVGEITFQVDAHGNLMQRSVTHPSGSNGVDAAALEAVREAAPFPPPPLGLPGELKWVYGGKAGG